MGFWEAVALIIKNWNLVMGFLYLIKKGVNEADLMNGLNRIEKGFEDAKTIKDAANAARSINDAFRK
jgi:hypothetical protein